MSRLISRHSDDSIYESLPSSVERPKTPPSFGALPSFGDVSALQPLGPACHGTRRDWLHIDSMGNPTYLQVSFCIVASPQVFTWSSPCFYLPASLTLFSSPLLVAVACGQRRHPFLPFQPVLWWLLSHILNI